MSINHPHYGKSFPKYIVSALSSHMHTLRKPPQAPTHPSSSHQVAHEFLRMGAAGVLDLNRPHRSNLRSKALSQTSVPATYPLYMEMNDLSVQPIKKCQSLYCTEDGVKTAFVFLLINIYDRCAVRKGKRAAVIFTCDLRPQTKSSVGRGVGRASRWSNITRKGPFICIFFLLKSTFKQVISSSDY